MMEAFPQAQRYIPGYQDGGQGADQQQIIMQYLQMFAQMQNMKIEELIQVLQQMPEQQQSQALQQIVQTVDQVLAQQQGQQGQQPEMAQQGEMPMDPNQAMQMAYGGASKLKKFTKKKEKGGSIENYPAAAELPDSVIYRRPVPNVPRLFEEGGSTLPQYQTLGTVFTPTPAVAESTVPFGYSYDPNTGRNELSTWTYPAMAVGAGAAGYGLYKGFPAARDYVRDAYRTSPMRRPVPEGKVMTDMSKDPVGKRFFTGMAEEPTFKEKTVAHNSAAERDLLAKHPEAEYKSMTTKKTGTPDKVTYEVQGDPLKYGEYSEYGNAKFVQDKVLPKHGISAKEWAAMSKTAEGRWLQRQYVLEANGYKNTAKGLKLATATLKKLKGMPTWAKISLAITAAGLGAAYYGYKQRNPEMEEAIGEGMGLNPEEQAQLDSLIKADSIAASKSGESNPFYLNPPRKKYGGPSSFSNYGAFTVPMAYGGSSSNAMPGIYDTDSYINDYSDNTFQRYLRENVDNSIYERMMERNEQMRRGGTSSKKKI